MAGEQTVTNQKETPPDDYRGGIVLAERALEVMRQDNAAWKKTMENIPPWQPKDCQGHKRPT